MILPEAVRYIIEKLYKGGYEAYAVGGCVRDSIMGVRPHDWDVCTSARPEKVLELLSSKNIIEGGLKHGTVTVSIDGSLYEITTYRSDGEYIDNRHPGSVRFITSLEDDLSRRDFTINAIAYNDKAGIADPFHGEDDIRDRIIRTVGDTDKRFSEDALRILRALRFSSRLGFTICEETSDSIIKNAHLLKNISQERITSEFLQIINGDYAEEILMKYSSVISVFIPEITAMIGLEQRNPHHIYDVWEHTVKVVVNSPKGRVSRLAAFFHDISKPECFFTDDSGVGHFKGHPEKGAYLSEKIMKRMKLDNKTISSVKKLIMYHDLRPEANEKNVRRLLSQIGNEAFEELMLLKKADASGQNPDMLEYKLEYIDRLTGIYKELTKNGERFTVDSLCINGSDLISLGLKPGKRIGMILEMLLDMVIDGNAKNEREVLIAQAKRIIDSECSKTE